LTTVDSVCDGAFWDIMAAFQTYGNRELIELIDFSFSELSVSLEELATSAHCFNLRKLFLEGCSNLGGGLSNISKLQHLEELLIWGTKVQGRTEDLSKLQHLTILSFSDSKVEGRTEDLSKLQHLTELSFANTKVEGSTEDLSKLQHLTKLDFSDTKVEGSTERFVEAAAPGTKVEVKTKEKYLTKLFFRQNEGAAKLLLAVREWSMRRNEQVFGSALSVSLDSIRFFLRQ